MLGICENSIAGKTAFVTAAPFVGQPTTFPRCFSRWWSQHFFVFVFIWYIELQGCSNGPAKRTTFWVFSFYSHRTRQLSFSVGRNFVPRQRYVASVIGDLHCCLHCCLNCSLHNCLHTFLLCCWNCNFHNCLHCCVHCCWGNGCTVVVLQQRRASCQGKWHYKASPLPNCLPVHCYLLFIATSSLKDDTGLSFHLDISATHFKNSVRRFFKI